MRTISCNFAALCATLCAATLFSAGGCASSPSDIPPSADMVAEGNRKLTYQAPRDGTVYLWDDNANRLVYSGDIDRNETFSLDAEDDRIMIDSRKATEYDLDPDHRMQVYFDDEPRATRRVRVEERMYERRYDQ